MPASKTTLSPDEHPWILLVQRLLAPLLVLICLWGVGWFFGEPLGAGRYVALATISFFLGLVIFDLPEESGWGRVIGKRQATGIIFAWLIFSVVLLIIGLVSGQVELYPRRVLVSWFLITPILVIIGEYLLNDLVIRVIASRKEKKKIVIAGINDLGRELIQRMESNPYLGMSFEAGFDDRAVDRIGDLDNGKLKGKLGDLPEYVKKHDIDAIFITLPMAHQTRILDLLDQLRDTTASIYFVPDIFIFDLIQARVEDVDGLLAVAICETPFYGTNAILKRLTDIVVSSAVLLLGSPIFLMIALGVKMSSPGPVIFKQRRYGVDGKEITVYKFRTMTVCEDGDEVIQATKDDPRVTPFGAVLRRTSMDELPQFFNVLQGRMSVVGPRPHAISHNEMYRRVVKGYMIRHKVKPGITGLAQVSGYRGETGNIEKMRKRIEYDLDYLRHWSLALDLRIILKTVLIIFRDRNAY